MNSKTVSYALMMAFTMASLGVTSEAAIPEGTSTNGSVAIGNQSISHAINGVAVGPNAEAGGASTAIGESAKAPNSVIFATAIGRNAKALANQGLAVGVNSEATGSNATSIGLNSTSTSVDSIAIGTRAEAKDINTSVLGAYAHGTGSYAVAIGANSNATAPRSISIGVAVNQNKGETYGAVAASAISMGNNPMQK